LTCPENCDRFPGMAFLVDAHHTLANMVSLYALIVGLWGLVSFLRRAAPTGNYNGALALGFGLFLVEGIVGIILVATGLAPARWVHFLYGVTIILTLPAIFAFTRGSNTTRESLLYGLGMVFIWGLAERAAETGH
jgi:heme A synthase